MECQAVDSRRASVFFAIPCGEFFAAQRDRIDMVCRALGIAPVVVEDRSATDGLWRKITGAIGEADYFVADISSLSPNVIVELGYALREKRQRNCAIFVAESVNVPVDLQGFTLQKYSSLAGFQEALGSWLLEAVPCLDPTKLSGLRSEPFAYEEDFLSRDRFLRLWALPPTCSFVLTGQGLRFTNAHFPLMTSHLALLADYEFTFRAKIESSRIGWVVKGTRPHLSPLPSFCVMFSIDTSGRLVPHLWNSRFVDEKTHYQVLWDQVKDGTDVRFSEEGWAVLTTRVVGDEITILNGAGSVLYEYDFSQNAYYKNTGPKQGEIGFRCHPGEQAVVNHLSVTEL